MLKRFSILILLFPVLLFAQTGSLSTKEFAFDGKQREYLVYIPQIYDGDTKVPLIINLHGYSSNKEEQLFYGDFRKIADTANFILIVPNGLHDEFMQRRWNYFDPNGENDTDFLSELIDRTIDEYAIDVTRIYATGMSNGGFMSIYLACELSDKITAIASVTGTMLNFPITNCETSHPVPIMQIHGDIDMVVPYLGSLQFMSVSSVIDYWVNKNNCNPSPQITQVPNINTQDGSTAEHYLYTDGDDGTTIEHYKIIGGGHTWPGTFYPTNVTEYGNTNQDIDASKEIWRFFSQYSNPDTPLSTQKQSKSSLKIFPNPSFGNIVIESPKEISKLELISIDGKIIQQLDLKTNHVIISDLDKGNYIVKIKTVNEIIMKYLIVL